MKKFLFTVVVTMFALAGFSQFSNSWIDYNKTYYKFKINKDTLCRIYQPVLAGIGLQNTPAQNFQLWRNGKEVRLYTSVASGILGASDFIEFWGEMNDGKPDKTLYRDPAFQLDDKYSLFTDTATYYLTVNPAGSNLRYTQSANPVSTNILPADAYFMRRIEVHYKDNIIRGYAADLTEYVYSSAFDIGEGWSSANINSCCALSNVLQNINKYTGGPANNVMFTVHAFGNHPLYTRNLGAKLNGTAVLPAVNPMPYFSYRKDTVRNLPLSILNSNTFIAVSIKPENSQNPAGDYITVPTFSVTYPATFNFNAQKSFYFELAASATGNFVVINNFTNNGLEPVLYDMTSGRRYLGDINTAGQVKFALPPSSDPVRQFRLISQDPSNFITVASLSSKTFLNLSNTGNQGDYIIISNQRLYNNGAGVNYVDQYRQYRSSAVGGGYNAKVYNIDELTEQFGYGIANHPLAIRDFARYASQNFAVKPRFVFLIGRAVAYTDHNSNATNPDMDKLSLVPTFGWPASDILLVSNPGELVPVIPVGRIGAVSGNEVGNYLEKMKLYEQAQQSANQTIADKGWMKNIIHISGGADSLETASFVGHLNQYKQIAEDTLFGAHVETFAKSSAGPVQEASSARIEQLLKEGTSFISYFGHSSANTLAFNLTAPESYQNQGKYPFFNVSGCSAGNYFYFDPARLVGSMSLSEKYIFTSQKGSIGFLADSHFGIEPFLNYYNAGLYNEFSKNNYGGTIGDQMKKVIADIGSVPSSLDYYTRIHLEELLLQGDPALRINAHAKPDYVVEEQSIKINPSIISVADPSFTIDVKMLNIGKAIKDSIRVIVKRKLPNDTIKILFNQLMPAMKHSDSLNFIVPINPLTDKGLNKIIVTLDVDNRITELSESNNTTEKQFYIYEDEIRPVYPSNFSIVNTQNITYSASTANPLAQQRQYTMEIDTTELFNSAFKKSYSLTGNGGVIEFKPTNLAFTDNTVYYWRTSMPTSGNAPVIWNTASFVYLANSTSGWNQSHFYQHFKSGYTTSIALDSASRLFKFNPRSSIIITNNGMYPTSLQEANEFNLQINGAQYIQNNCSGQSFIFTLFNPASLNPVINALPGSPGRWGSINPCNTTTQYDFEFPFSNNPTPATGLLNRKKIRDFMDSIPSGYYVVLRLATADPNYYPSYPWTYAQDWKVQDEAAYGPGNSLTTKLKNAGFTDVDSFSRPRLWTFVYKKNDNSYTPNFGFNLSTEKHTYETTISGKQAEGTISSPVFGPSKKWDMLHWNGVSLETPTIDVANVSVYGIDNAGTSTFLKKITTARDTTLNFVDAAQYPFIQLQYYSSDLSLATPYQLTYWRINGQSVAEGTIAPNIVYQMKDTVDQGEIIDFKVAFKNISAAGFDSTMKFKLTITDNSNVPHPVNVPRGKILMAGDTLVAQYKIETKDYPGNNTLFLDINPDNHQPEQSHFNNILFKDFYVRPDNFNPLLDVTFDGVHILNKDIVAAKPHIYIKLKDESRFLLLTDTALLKVQVRYPDNTLHNYNFGDTMRFNPANTSAGDNSASIDFMPYFPIDGNYELIVTGKDVVGNKAGALEYHMAFSVINKAMISNLLNYPNPFTSSTAFVFTVTGSEVPQNIRIQILTITGKVVREITKDELGPIHIGRNITEFKWDGTDAYGQKLANGVYLYRVLTNFNGQSLEKYRADGDKTDKYFTKGYGKMVLIR